MRHTLMHQHSQRACLVFSPEGHTLVGDGETPEGTGEVLLWRTDQ